MIQAMKMVRLQILMLIYTEKKVPSKRDSTSKLNESGIKNMISKSNNKEAKKKDLDNVATHL